MTQRPDKEYDWLNDPFDEQKGKAHFGSGSKALFGVGCLVAVVLVIALLVVCACILAVLVSSY